MSYQGLAITITSIAALALATRARAEDISKVVDSSCIVDLVVYHSQGWGVMGVDTAAHWPEREPMELRIGDVSYDRGLGTHAPGETVMLLDGQYISFEAKAGVQWQGNQMGSVIMQAFVDGDKVFDSGLLLAATPAVPVKLDLRGARSLRLVVTDAGDGISGDLANWAGARLTRHSGIATADKGTAVDMAPFAEVRTWDPSRVERATPSRLEPISAEELFLGTPVRPDADGAYTVPVTADGHGCIGIEWLERRRIARLELVPAKDSHIPDGIVAQYWEMGYRGRREGGSRWQGQWRPLSGDVVRDGNRWVMRPDWAGKPENRTGALKFRWVFPALPEPVRLARVRALSPSEFEQAEVTLSVEGAPEGAEGVVDLYNGAFVGTGDIRKTWRLNEPLAFTVRYALPHTWQLTDRTVLRLTLPTGSFGIAVDDIVKEGPVYVAHAGLLASTGDQPGDPLAYRAAIAGRKTLLSEVRMLPDQTREQALERVYIPEASHGPTMLSLANDNRKFVLDRSGKLTFENDQSIYRSIAGTPRAYSCELTTDFGSDRPEDIGRFLEREWFPIVVIDRADGNIALRQRTFVAPLGKRLADDPVWLRERALAVVEFTVANAGDQPAPVSFALSLSARYPEDKPTLLRVEGHRAYFEKDGALLAVVEPLGDALALTAEGEGSLRVEGALRAGEEAQCVAYLPSWERADAGDLPPATASSDLARQTVDYWKEVVGEGMRVEVPDPLINDLIPASVMHCMMAARNDQGRTVAPWIATLLYGPWDSEAQAVIRGMHIMGQMDFAQRGLEYFIERYNDEGFFTTGYTVMGTGWHLWTLGECYALTRNEEWMREHASEVERVCRWVMAEREKTKRLDAHGEKVPEYGLMPPGVMADWDAFNYYFYLNSFYYAGLQAAGAALADIGSPSAAEVLDNAAEFREEIQRAFRWVQERAPVVKLRDGTWVPFYPTHVYSPSPIGHLYAGEDQGRSWIYDIELGAHHMIALGVLDPTSPAADWMIDHMEDVQFLRPGWGHYESEEANRSDWFNLGGFSKCQPYYTRIGELHALRDDVEPFVRTYFNSVMSLLNKEDLSFWEHFVSGAFNKTHETSYYLHQTRLMLVQEREDELWLAPFITNNWLKDGMRVSVVNAPTVFGDVSFTLESRVDDGYVDVHVEPPLRQKPRTVVVRVRHPEGGRLVRAECEGAAQCEVDEEESTVRFSAVQGAVRIRCFFE